MGNALISRRGGGYAKIEFDNYTPSNVTLDRLDITVTPLSVARDELAATTVGNYAIFAGGKQDGTKTVATVDAYNSNLVRSTPTQLYSSDACLAATAVGDYALFGSWYYIYVYNSNLVKCSNLYTEKTKGYYAGTTTGDCAFFAGGYDASNSAVGYAEAYSSSLTRFALTDLSVKRYHLAATSVGGYAIFGGGDIGSNNGTDAVDAYRGSNFVKSTLTDLNVARNNLAATTVGNYAIFGGGNYATAVDAYNNGLTKTSITSLSVGGNYISATTIDNYALFGAGYAYYTDGNSAGSRGYATVEAYSSNLTKSTLTDLSDARYDGAATTVGDYALFAGGDSNSTPASSVVDAYGISGKISVYRGSKYKFQYMDSEVTATSDYDEMNVPVPITGYIEVKNVTYS